MRISRVLILVVAFCEVSLASGEVAKAACILPYQISNGQTADASQVMADLNALAACISAAPSGATNSIQYNAGAGTFGGVGPLANGQLAIGSTGNAPQGASITAGQGIVVTNAPGSITIASSGGGGGRPLITILEKNTSQDIGINTWTTLNWQVESIDEVNAVDLATSSTRMVTPSSFTKVRFILYTVQNNNTSGRINYQSIVKNGSDVQVDIWSASNEAGHATATRWFPTTSGDIWTCRMNSPTNDDPQGTGFASPTYWQAEWSN